MLSDWGAPIRVANPGKAAHDRSFGLDDAGWARLADGVARAADLARSRGFEPTFHHHAGIVRRGAVRRSSGCSS